MPRVSKKNSPGPRSQLAALKMKAELERFRNAETIRELREEVQRLNAIVTILRARVKTLKQSL